MSVSAAAKEIAPSAVGRQTTALCIDLRHLYISRSKNSRYNNSELDIIEQLFLIPAVFLPANQFTQELTKRLFKMLKIPNIKQLQLLLRASRLHCQLPNVLTSYSNEALRKQSIQSHLQIYRNICFTTSLQKYNKKDIESDSDDEDEAQFKDERDSKVVKARVNSLRADLILKAGLGIARNKVENIFYESRIRINGKKLQKKSIQLHEGDEIDVIRGFSQQNPSHLVISRVIILAANEREEGLSVQLRRYKSLLIENYPGANAFKSSSSADH
ncbi:uncharacterized protein LOC142231632 [Haematobia irritans]|uniref:uncharacterized protein LOC142231632 n=1 Tax=Haematobia irritans TaxID=7368 RepID=UPI003F4F6A83